MKPRYSLLSRFLLLTAFAAAGTAAHAAAPRIRVLLIDGQNNHGAWPQTSQVIKTVLEQSGRFDVTISRTPPDDGRKPNYGAPQPTVEDMPAELQEAWARWRPDFSKADVVISNYNGVLWPEPVREAFEAFVREGGGFVALHAADNAFAQWEEYQRMVGVGGWYGRNTRTHGPRIHWEDGRLVKDPAPHYCGAHGKRSPVLVEIRDPEHPIVRGFPEKWLHPLDEVYYNMCGPAEHLHVIATAFSDAETGGSGKDQPILLTVNYGRGRVVHNMLGHDMQGFTGRGFQHLLLRSAEWAATGEVTFPAPPAGDFSTEEALQNPAPATAEN